MVLERLIVWHIDQQYKCFENKYFTVVEGKLDILVGYRDHVSGCVNSHAKTADKMMGSSFLPQPGLSYQRKATIKVQRPASAAPFITSSLREFNRCRGSVVEDTVALRMWSYLLESDDEFRCLSPEIEVHREDSRKVAIEKTSKKQAAAVLKMQAKGIEDNELHETLDRMLSTGEPLPVPLAEDTKSHSVLAHIKHNGMEVQGVLERHILAMLNRGLCVRTKDGASDSILSCCLS
jgi:hypothetical protein